MIRWLPITIGLFFVWASLLLRPPFNIDSNLKYHAMLAPIYFLLIFILVSIFTIIYRVKAFKDCTDAYHQLENEIIESRENLKKKGFSFD